MQCTRSDGERLAELLIDCNLFPWKAKSQSLSAVADDEDQTTRVEEFIERLRDSSITWAVAAGRQSYGIPLRSATACTVGSRTLTPRPYRDSPPIGGEAVMLHDGGMNTYGTNQEKLREQAASKFNASFQSEFCPVYISSMPKGDLTYPEITAADYIAGYIRYRLEENASVETLPEQVSRIQSSWRDKTLAPLPLYRLRSSNTQHSRELETRIVSWIQGQRPPRGDELTTHGTYENVVKRLDSETVREYLLELRE